MHVAHSAAVAMQKNARGLLARVPAALLASSQKASDGGYRVPSPSDPGSYDHLLPADELATAIGTHYLYAVLRQVHHVVLSVEMLDAPMAAVRALGMALGRRMRAL